MFKRFARGEVEPQMGGADPVLLADPSDQVGPSIFEFVDNHNEALASSRESWSEIAEEASLLRTPEYTEPIKDGIRQVWDNEGHVASEHDLELATDKLASELTTYSLISARYFSTRKNSVSDTIKTSKQLVDHWLKLPDRRVSFIIGRSNKSFPTRRFIAKQVRIDERMISADDNAREVLSSLAGMYIENPENLEELDELYSRGVVDSDPNFRELRKMINADWHHPDKKKSVLRSFCQGLREDPSRYLDAFSQEVAGEEPDKRLQPLQDMAKFAIISSSEEEITKESIARTISASYRRWGDIEGVDSIFRTFVSMKVEDIERILNKVAGPKLRSVRNHPTELEIKNLQQGFSISEASDRYTRRKEKRRFQRANGSALATIKEIEAEAAVRQNEHSQEPEPKRVCIAKNGQNGSSTLDEIDSSEIASTFKMDQNDPQIDDVTRMIEWLRKYPLSPASRTLRDKSIKIGSKNQRLYRFAPDVVNGGQLRIRGENRYTRIVYAITEEAIVIVDLSSHEAYNKKWL